MADTKMEVEEVAPAGTAMKKRFEVFFIGRNFKQIQVKKWNAVALWAWDIVVDTCAICRNHIMDLCIECQANQVDLLLITFILYRHPQQMRNVLLPGVFAIMLFISIAFHVGFALDRFNVLIYDI